MLDPSDTIVASAGAPGPAARGLVRLSGPLALTIALDGFETDHPAPSGPAALDGSIRLDGLATPLPATVIVWPGPRSYTGGPLAEIHTVGSPPLLQAVVAYALARGARPAEPGEFTLRAFLSGRIDLAQSEAVLAVIEATAPNRLETALRQLAGGLSGPIRDLRDLLLDRLVEIEADLDFVDEADVSPVRRAALIDAFDEALARLDSFRTQHRDRDLTEARPRVVLVGRPNAGKSRLFNALVGDDRAIVSPAAGTTRDHLVAPCDCDGLVVDLVDTAGEESAGTAIESAAQSQRVGQRSVADLILHCRPADAREPIPDDPSALSIETKSDLNPGPAAPGVFPTSAATGLGLAALRSAIARALRSRPTGSETSGAVGVQSRESLDRAAAALRIAREVASGDGGEELIAVELRQAIDDLGRVVGAVVTEDILDRIFRRFCIGK